MASRSSTASANTDGQETAILEARDLARFFDVSPPFLNRILEGKGRQVLKAVDGLSFSIPPGKTFSLVGESGCGKSTVARLVVGLYEPTRGDIFFDGQDMAAAKDAESKRRIRSRMQMIFQDPYASLNPRWRVQDIIAEPIRHHKLLSSDTEVRDRVGELLTQVGVLQ